MVNFVTLDLLTSTTQGNFANFATHEWRLVWEIYNFPFQTQKTKNGKAVQISLMGYSINEFIFTCKRFLKTHT